MWEDPQSYLAGTLCIFYHVQLQMVASIPQKALVTAQLL